MNNYKKPPKKFAMVSLNTIRDTKADSKRNKVIARKIMTPVLRGCLFFPP